MTFYVPRSEPTGEPTHDPTDHPTFSPTTPRPTWNPSTDPTSDPTTMPSSEPTANPSSIPTLSPSFHPSFDPTTTPSLYPSSNPSADPSSEPTNRPSITPTMTPSLPTLSPSVHPTRTPSSSPSSSSSSPSSSPSLSPTPSPSIPPTATPSSPSSPSSPSPSPYPIAIAIPTAFPTTTSVPSNVDSINNDAATATLMNWADAHPIWYFMVGALVMLLFIILLKWSVHRFRTCQQYKVDAQNLHYFGQQSFRDRELKEMASISVKSVVSDRTQNVNVNGVAINGSIEIEAIPKIEVDAIGERKAISTTTTRRRHHKQSLSQPIPSEHLPKFQLYASGVLIGSDRHGDDDAISNCNGVDAQNAGTVPPSTRQSVPMYNGVVDPQSAFADDRIRAYSSPHFHSNGQYYNHHQIAPVPIPYPQPMSMYMAPSRTPYGPAAVLSYIGGMNAYLSQNQNGIQNAQRMRSQSAMMPHSNCNPSVVAGAVPPHSVAAVPPPPPPMAPADAVHDDMIIVGDHETPQHDIALDEMARPSVKSSGGDDDGILNGSSSDAASSSDDASFSDDVNAASSCSDDLNVDVDVVMKHALSATIDGVDVEEDDEVEHDGALPFPPQQVQGVGALPLRHRAHLRSVSDLRGIKGLNLSPHGMQWVQHNLYSSEYPLSPMAAQLQSSAAPDPHHVGSGGLTQSEYENQNGDHHHNQYRCGSSMANKFPSTLSVVSDLSDVTASVGVGLQHAHSALSAADSYPTFTNEKSGNFHRVSSLGQALRLPSLYGYDTKKINSLIRKELKDGAENGEHHHRDLSDDHDLDPVDLEVRRPTPNLEEVALPQNQLQPQRVSRVRFSLFQGQSVSEQHVGIGNMNRISNRYSNDAPDEGDLPPLDEDEKAEEAVTPDVDAQRKRELMEPGSVDWSKSRGSLLVKKSKNSKKRKKGKRRRKKKEKRIRGRGDEQ